MRAYYGSRFSPNMTVTPEGFLIAHNVPIARTGWYEYLGEEIGVTEMRGQIVQVYRSPEEVFSPAAMASFEGKVTTDEHPPEAVTPDNATRYMRGVVQNVRQGSGDEDDLLIADLVFHDQTLIYEIQEGKREVSCGYDCIYEQESDGYHQKHICGNHVAVVKSGRAGDRVAIKDSKTNPVPEGEKRMKISFPKKSIHSVKDILAAVGLKVFATDAEPEEIMDAVSAMAEEKEGAKDEGIESTESAAKDADPAIEALTAQVAHLTDLVTKLAQTKGADAAPEDAIDAAISEIEGSAKDNDEEESHTISAENMDEEGPVSSPEDRPKSALTGDNAYKVAALRALKPIIAQITDPAERKRASDAAIASIRGVKPTKNTYADINKGQKQSATDNKQTSDNKTAAQQDPAQLGREIARKHNPHFKDRA
ncbi:DUF2213 domain-containing protein [Paenibacillus sp. 2RAB27]|uniref:DUF2213 domain-containing protein n=1 Tax=Paenibacillus sp. 2RAB27 TaxID=3232991 RepID=UPI003F9E4132